MNLHLPIEPARQALAGGFKVEPGLQIHPELSFHCKKAPQSQGRICSDAPLSVYDFVDAARRHFDCVHQVILTHLHRLEEIFQQDLAQRRQYSESNNCNKGYAP